jgi:phosphomannomutase
MRFTVLTIKKIMCIIGSMTNSDMMKLQNGSDIRGVAVDGVEGEHVNLTEDACNRIGQAFALWLAAKKGRKPADLVIGVGRDARISGPALATATAQGLAAQGVTVVDCGLATTPAMFMSIVFSRTSYDGSVMITASHLPFNRNGIKFFDADGGLEHEDITAVLEKACTLSAVQADVSRTKTADLLSLYSDHLRKTICGELGEDENSKPLAGLKIVVDAGNGDAGFFVTKILDPLGADTAGSQFLEPDGMFPNHIPNPENKAAMEAVRAATVNNHADLGLIFDTDVDRMSAVLHTGAEVNRDAIIALISAILAPKYPGGTIITDSVTSDRLTYFIEKKLGMKHLRYMRGYKNVIDKCKELNKAGIVSPLAMETSGHGALRDNYYLDDGAFLAVKLIIAVAQAAKQGRKIDSLIAELPPPGEEGEYRFRINTEDFKSYGQSVLDEFRKRAQKAGYDLPESFEGIRISFHDETMKGWLLLRLSLHDPVMPLNIEGERPGDLAKIVHAAKDLMRGFDKLDMSCLK